MEQEKELTINNEEKKAPKNSNKGTKKIAIKKRESSNDSVQYNSQELEQEQTVLVNPAQINSQNSHVFLINSPDALSGKISGVTYSVKTHKNIGEISIELFFGNEIKTPILKLYSDQEGKYIISDIPSGYYTLLAQNWEGLRYHSQYIKVLPGQHIYYPIPLS